MSLDKSIGKAFLKYTSQSNSTPDVAGGNKIQIYTTEVRNTFGKDINYIPLPKASSDYKEKEETLALDFKKAEDKFNITGKIYSGKDGKYSLPSGLRDSNDDGEITSENLSFNEFGNSGNPNTHKWHLLGATRLKNGSVTVTNTTQSTTLTEGTDYNLDYNRGLIELFDTGDTALGDNYEIDYTFSGRNDNVARVIKRMAQRGGNALLEVDPNSYTQSSGEEGSQYMIEFDTFEYFVNPERPDEVEISADVRVAIDRI